MFFHHFLFYRLSVFLEPIDPARKKHPVNNLEVLTLSYKVSSVSVFAYISLFEAAMLIFTYFALWRFPGLLTLWSAPSVRRSTIKCFSSCCRSNGPNTVWTRSDSVVWAFIALWKQLGHVNGISPSCFYYGKLFVSVDFTDVTKKLEGALGEEVKVKEPINQQIHRMCLLRVKLMHFVNSLHNYITTRVRRVMK